MSSGYCTLEINPPNACYSFTLITKFKGNCAKTARILSGEPIDELNRNGREKGSEKSEKIGPASLK